MFVYAALGDSITYGYSASSIEKSYPSRIISKLNAKGLQARHIVIARPGWTVEDLDGAVHRNPETLRNANKVSVWIGGEDLIRYGQQVLGGSAMPMEAMFQQFAKRFDTMLGFIRGDGGHLLHAIQSFSKQCSCRESRGLAQSSHNRYGF